MNLSDPAFSYLFMIIPMFFALTVIGQGIQKIARERKDGPGVLIFGILLLAMIAYAYFAFIRV